MEKAALATTFCFQSSANAEDRGVSVYVCLLSLSFIFFLGSEKREREGEQVLLTWALGYSANNEFTKERNTIKHFTI
jgi:hypothetical protein